MLSRFESDSVHDGKLTPASSRRRFVAAAIMIPSLLALTGCGESDVRLETFPVTGSLNVDGKPAPGATLVFHPVKVEGDTLGAAPNARVKDDGSFSVSSYGANDGAPAGEYTVTVSWYKVNEEGGPGPNILPSLYASPTTSPIKAIVNAGAPTALEPIAVSTKTARGAAPVRR
jgi:hypothetical protein